MEVKDIVALAITGAIGIVLIVMAIIMLSGRGANLIAGYNTLSDQEKRKYDTKRLARFMGGILLPIGLAFPCIAIGGIFVLWWMPIVFIGLSVGLLIFAIIYANTGNRFKK